MSFKVIDLFCGAGGMSEGILQAGLQQRVQRKSADAMSEEFVYQGGISPCQGRQDNG